MIRCAVFDADGTLLDSMPMWRKITYDYMSSKGLTAPEGLHRELNRLSIEQCADYYGRLGVPGTRQEIVKELEYWAYREYRQNVNLKPHAAEFVRLLWENGVGVAVATASQAEGVAAALERFGIARCVKCVLTCTQVGKSKEHPDIFLQCAAEFGASPRETVIFEDSAHALKTAKLAGFPTVAVSDPISMEDGGDLLIRQWADRLIDDYDELIRELTPPEDDFPLSLSRSVTQNQKNEE